MSKKYNCKCNNCKYIPKKEVKQYKKIMDETIIKIKKDLKQKYGKSCNSAIVGSTKRNLVVQKGDSHWDVDYQFIFLSPKYNDEDIINPYDLKEFIRNSFKQELGDEYSVKMSTSVITICLKDKGNNAIKSFDIALIRKQDSKILRGKSNVPSSLNFVKWEPLSTSNSIYEQRNEIKGSTMWTLFRKIFINKKCINMKKEKDNQKPTFSLYLETIKEVLDKKIKKQ